METLQGLYDPAIFAKTGMKLIDQLEDYLRAAQTPPFKALPWKDPQVLKKRALELMDGAPQGDAARLDGNAIADRISGLAAEFLSTNNCLHSPHYMGHQVAPSLPVAGIFESIGSTVNVGAGVYEMGPLPNAVERAMVQKLGSYLGWEGRQFDGIVTHGGSAANLTAILAARNIRYPDSWRKGLERTGKGLPAIVCSAESHYSIARAAAIIGLGAEQVIKAPIDAQRRLDDAQLERVIDQAAANGREVFCVVGSACATPTGAFDRLEAIGEICRKRGLWFHVDAAHGGGLMLSRKHRHLLKGTTFADSVTWDAHKMMFVPALCTFLFYRDARHSYQAFEQDAPYLFAKGSTLEFDSAVRTLECTKRPLAMALWSIWCVYGPQVFERLVDRTIELAQEFHAMLDAAPDFEVLHVPQCNILCFRYLPDEMKNASPEQISDSQVAIRRKLVEGGDFYITATRIDQVMALRVTLMNPLTERSHLEALMQAIRRSA